VHLDVILRINVIPDHLIPFLSGDRRKCNNSRALLFLFPCLSSHKTICLTAVCDHCKDLRGSFDVRDDPRSIRGCNLLPLPPQVDFPFTRVPFVPFLRVTAVVMIDRWTGGDLLS
jgi:hypothetical protein